MRKTGKIAERGIVDKPGVATRTLQIGGRNVGPGYPCFIIAEAGVNHNGRLDLAENLIDEAAGAGADAIKFQTYKTGRLTSHHARKAPYQEQAGSRDESQFEMLAGLELAYDDFHHLEEYARARGIMFLSTPFDGESVDFLDSIGVPAFKISSGEITNTPLIRRIGETGKPVIVSTGMATLGDIEETIRTLRSAGSGEILLLHCVSAYPAQIGDTNLRAMETLSCAFDVPVGFSDHTLGITASVAAVALGACVIEKHVTLDKSLPGPDHRISVDPGELRALVRSIRDVESALGTGVKIPCTDEAATKAAAGRSIVSSRKIRAGETITEDMVELKRPGTGIKPKYLDLVVGSKAARNLVKDTVLSWSDLTIVDREREP